MPHCMIPKRYLLLVLGLFLTTASYAALLSDVVFPSMSDVAEFVNTILTWLKYATIIVAVLLVLAYNQLQPCTLSGFTQYWSIRFPCTYK